ncbi:CLUMA_CG004488, isoform A [Clunio marinus]|uniref:CLUMA_CG004488, isoform A n=1 Tax=Clunio marinus TaxID=568069 RepID=A0A1J1HWA8_9DIPT|nr:CLUMA_CG004488, isoform A [Clunio marinus]
MLKTAIRNIGIVQGLKQFYSSSSTVISRKPDQRQVELMARSLPHRKKLKDVGNIIVVASGKGGVGKTTTAVNLAISLSLEGKSVGILDGDIFGPTVPLMMNLKEMPLTDENNMMIPLVNYGIKCLSMGLLMEDSSAVVWRGPLVMSALQRLLKGAAWGPLDILIVDTPPGTGDVHLSLSQNVPLSGVILVSTPQTAALNVTKRGADMYKTLKVPIIGIVENMSYVICENCKHKNVLYNNAIDDFSKEMNIDVIGKVPLEKEIIKCCEAGTPSCIKYPDSSFSESYRHISKYIIKYLEEFDTIIANYKNK